MPFLIPEGVMRLDGFDIERGGPQQSRKLATGKTGLGPDIERKLSGIDYQIGGWLVPGSKKEAVVRFSSARCATEVSCVSF